MPVAKGKILVVDDKPSIREFMGEILEAEGYSVVMAKNGDEGLDVIRKNDFNLVFLDLRFPDGIDGIQVLEEALRAKPKLQIVIMSAYGEIKDAVEATRLGAYDFIEKDHLDQERMLVTAKRALEKDLMLSELEIFKKEAQEKYKMIGISPAIKHVYKLIEKASQSKAKVLIAGESGVGKELVAGAIHYLSSRAARPFIKVNCAAIPTELIESELFGIEKAVATGVDKRVGKFELADEGTIFLDEIADMSPATQAKVLRVLENGEIQKVGGNETLNVDVRIIAATRKDLNKEIEAGHFREDLYFRLAVLTIVVPPLRERKEDIPLLLNYFMESFCDEYNVSLKRFTLDAASYLCDYPWKGNIRELKSLIERIVLLVDDGSITRQKVISAFETSNLLNHINGNNKGDTILSLKEYIDEKKREYIQRVIESCDGNITKASSFLQIDRTNFYKMMKRLGIDNNPSSL